MEKQFLTQQSVVLRSGGALLQSSLEEDLVDVRGSTVVIRQGNGRIATVVQNGSITVDMRNGRSQCSSTVVQSRNTAGVNSVQFSNMQVNNCGMNSCVQMNVQNVVGTGGLVINNMVLSGGNSSAVSVGGSNSIVSVDGGSGISVSVNGYSVNVGSGGNTVSVSGSNTIVKFGDY